MDEEETREYCRRIAFDKLRELVSQPMRERIRSEGETGGEYMHRLLYIHPRLCKEQLRLTSDMLLRLTDIMVSRGLLQNGRKIHVTEQIGMTLHILGKGSSYRDVADTFKHSVSTVQNYFLEVLKALKVLSFDIIRPHTSLDEVPSKISGSRLYSPYFKDCVGAIDGTHIEAIIADDCGIQYRGRKGTKTWNVLASCSFDMLFTYVNVGWEGSVHDITVLRDSISQSKYCFPHPPQGKYYLVDSGYPNTIGYLAPYKNKIARYHMPDFKSGRKPNGLYEVFNYRHSSLRTTIERAFGILKQRWKILRCMPQTKAKRQLKIIIAAFTLNNFIRMQELMIPILQHPQVQGTSNLKIFDKDRKAEMNQVRDSIAREIMESIGELGEDLMEEDD